MEDHQIVGLVIVAVRLSEVAFCNHHRALARWRVALCPFLCRCNCVGRRFLELEACRHAVADLPQNSHLVVDFSLSSFFDFALCLSSFSPGPFPPFLDFVTARALKESWGVLPLTIHLDDFSTAVGRSVGYRSLPLCSSFANEVCIVAYLALSRPWMKRIACVAAGGCSSPSISKLSKMWDIRWWKSARVSFGRCLIVAKSTVTLSWSILLLPAVFVVTT